MSSRLDKEYTYEDYLANEYFNEEDRRRLARMLMMSRAESGMSQERVALEMGIAKKTVQNWEKGVSAPTLPQAVEWFRVMKVPAIPYFLQFMFPDLEGTCGYDPDEKVRAELVKLIESLPADGVRQLMYLFFGNHGSSPRAVMHMVNAHLQTPLKERYSNACAIVNDYKLNRDIGNIAQPTHIQPDIELLEKAIEEGRKAILDDKESYLLINR